VEGKGGALNYSARFAIIRKQKQYSVVIKFQLQLTTDY